MLEQRSLGVYDGSGDKDCAQNFSGDISQKTFPGSNIKLVLGFENGRCM
jgi:hypothetical protein